jgi:hypothetical protein
MRDKEGKGNTVIAMEDYSGVHCCSERWWWGYIEEFDVVEKPHQK